MLRELQPNSTAHRRDQYSLAWDALVNKPEDYNPQQRAHAKCWLTYRAVDGEVSLTDWLMKVEPEEVPKISDGKTALRWKLSQWTAETYLFILTHQEWVKTAQAIVAYMHAGALDEYPGTCTNCMRITAMLAYHEFLEGNPSAPDLAEAGMNAWKNSWASFNIRENPLRFAELPADAAPLHVMMSIYRQDMAARPWADKLIHDSAASVWGKCIAEISKKTRRLW